MKGKIVGINKTKNGITALVQGKYSNNPIEGQINFTIDRETEIVNEEGKKLKIKYIKEGMEVKVYYDRLNMSLPAKGHANKIVVLRSYK